MLKKAPSNAQSIDVAIGDVQSANTTAKWSTPITTLKTEREENALGIGAGDRVADSSKLQENYFNNQNRKITEETLVIMRQYPLDSYL